MVNQPMTTAEQIVTLQERISDLECALLEVDPWSYWEGYYSGQIDLLSEQIAELRRREDKRGK